LDAVVTFSSWPRRGEEVNVNPPTVILVHGAWHGAWCWRDLVAILDREGVAWRAPDLPSSHSPEDPTADLARDRDAVVAAAADVREGPVILVGHSYGGVVVTEAAPALANLTRVVYVAALVPLPGQSATDASRESPRRTVLDESMRVIDGHIELDPIGAERALYRDCTPDVRSWAISHLSGQTIASFRSRRGADRVDAHTRYVLCREDEAIDPALQETMAQRTDEVVTITSGHSPFLSHPAQLVDIILRDPSTGT
jgi:pimeloyl-ACP methyl ester carboxylesterase